jgi:hypothetical protein
VLLLRLVFVEDSTHPRVADTVVPWHHAGFQLYWRFLSRVRNPVARRRVNKEIQNLPGAGWPLFAITVTLSLLWISSQSNGHPQAALLLL